MAMKKVLTIAGSDSGGGAGIQADIRTMTALGVWGFSAVTALTAQNTLGVAGVHPVPPRFLALQLETVLGDIGADAAKTGMLHSAEIIEVAAEAIRRFGLTRLVVDPVMTSKSGHPLLEEDAVRTLIDKLLPLAMVVTPNLREASLLTGENVTDLAGMKRAAAAIAGLGPRCVVVKGGHLVSGAPDVFYDGAVTVLEGKKLASGPVHGTGCTFSAALASGLALGKTPLEAARMAKDFVTRSIAAARPVGRGYPPANQMFRE